MRFFALLLFSSPAVLLSVCISAIPIDPVSVRSDTFAAAYTMTDLFHHRYRCIARFPSEQIRIEHPLLVRFSRLQL